MSDNKLPFNMYSDRKIVSSSLPLRQDHQELGMMADELATKMSHFEQNSTNDVVYNELKLRTQKLQ